MYTYTEQHWKEMMQKLDAGEQVEVSEEICEHFLNVLPPIGNLPRFACSEPVRHNDNGDPVYNCFVKIAGRHFAKQMSWQELKKWQPIAA